MNALKATALQAESQNDCFFLKNGQTAIQIKTYTRTYNPAMTEIINHSRSTALERPFKTLLDGLKSILRDHKPCP